MVDQSKIKTVSEQIADILREDIFSGKFHPGAKLKEKEISELMNVSRTPIREAFRILQSDGLVEISTNKGVQVINITEEDVVEVCELRMILETHCIKKIIKTFDEDDFLRMKETIKKTEEMLIKKDYFSYFTHSVNFHGYFMSLCQNERLNSAFLNARNSIRCAQMVLGKSQTFFRNAINLHKEILQSIKEKNLDRSVKLMRKHLQSNCENMIKNIGKLDKDSREI